MSFNNLHETSAEMRTESETEKTELSLDDELAIIEDQTPKIAELLRKITRWIKH